MEQPNAHGLLQYELAKPGQENNDASSRGFMISHSNSTDSNKKPPELNFTDVKPVLNYSIQTGEEFALEFMMDRVNPRKPFVPNTPADPSVPIHTTSYMELKGILGISHTGSESGSDVSMLSIVERGQKEFERKNSSLAEDRSAHGSAQPSLRTSSDYNSNSLTFHVYPSSGTSDSSSTRIKVLCSFGGRILPRPSDCKLRYVGGETRILSINKDISWQELWQKIIVIYNQTHAIKYQLPGEDLDALVSVSCDEDLQNMIEECHILGYGEGSKKLRMFLLSVTDLEDAHFSLGSSDADSEIQYVVAVNCLDTGSRKSSNLHGMASTSGNNLSMLDINPSVERETNRARNDLVFGNQALSTGIVSLSTIQPPQPIVATASVPYEPSQFHNSHILHHVEAKPYPGHYAHELHDNYIPFSMGPVPLPPHGISVHPGELIMSRVKSDGSIQQEFGNDFTQPSINNYVGQAEAFVGKFTDPFPGKEPLPHFSELEGKFLLSSKNDEIHHVPVSSTSVNVNEPQVLKSHDNSCQATSECANSESDPLDLSYLAPPTVPSQRTFFSERAPREQAELLSRLSKSDDSLGSQLLSGHPHSGATTKDFISDTLQKLQNENMVLHTEQLILPQNPTLVDPHAFTDGMSQLHPLKQVFSDADIKGPIDEDIIHKPQNETTVDKEMEKDLLVNGKTEIGDGGFSSVNQVIDIKHHEDALHGLPDKTENNAIADNTEGAAQTSSWMENTTKDAYQEDPIVEVSKPEGGDILIDINDRFPRDFLSDIFSKALLSDNSPGINQLQNDGAGLSLNIENQDPKRWSFFKKIAGEEFTRRDVSLIDQDQYAYPPGLSKVEEEAPLSYDFSQFTADVSTISHVDAKINYGGGDHKEVDATLISENAGLISDYNPSLDGITSFGLSPLDPSLGDIDISTLQIIKNEDLEELRELGSGTFGTVYHGKWRGTDVAIKRIKKSCFTARSSEQERLTVEFWREADILSKLHHPNVMAFYGVVQDGPGGTLATVTEYMVDGSLRHVLLRKDRHLDRRRKLIIAMDAAFGMEYLHSKNIVHFDLKCENLLVNLKDPSRPICKVGDFGLSKIKRNTLVSGGVRGTLPWMAPELLNGSSNKVSEKVDVFSFGIVLWEILTGEEPYANMHYGAIIGGIVNNTLRPTIPGYCDSEWGRLMEQCWAPSPEARPSFTEVTGRLRVLSAACHSKGQVHKASS
ncbi:uncharacterized protein LOC124930959 [Impatiens glandulifera]|uniref:uncharacterized protein LOC124930959 n=1 Tax=Impatiens glandulifera TaxID=253017 RepID=UPI001FB1057D|nr:uncharacterized protein LOC124930959 [Impatiens glandulifera]